MCVFVLPVSRLLNLKSEVTTKLEHVIETFIEISGVSNVQLIFDIYSQCECVFFGEYDLSPVSVVISEHMFQGIVSVDACRCCP